MKTLDFDYALPGRLIAQQPLECRSASRMLKLRRSDGAVSDLAFRDLPGQLRAGDLLVMNNTRVMPARLFARKDSGGKVEILIERIIAPNTCLAQVRASKSPREGSRLELDTGESLRVSGRKGMFFELQAPGVAIAELLERRGHMPLPPYIDREDSELDFERYQTVFASVPGAVAAPTAGLHLDEGMLDALRSRDIRTAEVTLHVGAGTFSPVRTDRIEDHQMHAEYLEVDEACCVAVEETRQRGGRVIAVGTTTVRSLETAAAGGKLEPFHGDSDLFIYPGYEFRVIDGLITNFHLPRSTLLMLVSAFAGTAETLAAYRHAVNQEYRFFSYGDAMLVV